MSKYEVHYSTLSTLVIGKNKALLCVAHNLESVSASIYIYI